MEGWRQPMSSLHPLPASPSMTRHMQRRGGGGKATSSGSAVFDKASSPGQGQGPAQAPHPLLPRLARTPHLKA